MDETDEIEKGFLQKIENGKVKAKELNDILLKIRGEKGDEEFAIILGRELGMREEYAEPPDEPILEILSAFHQEIKQVPNLKNIFDKAFDEESRITGERRRSET